MSQPSFSRYSRPVLSERSSVTNAARSSSSLPSTTFAAPTVVRFHAPPLSKAIVRGEPTSPIPSGKENAGGSGSAGETAASPAVALSPHKAAVQVVVYRGSLAHSPPSSLPPPPPPSASLTAVTGAESSPTSADAEVSRLSFMRPTERVLRIHSISDRESLARLSVEPSYVAHPAPSFRYSLRSSYRPYQWTAARGSVGGRPSSVHPPATESGDDGQRPLQSSTASDALSDSAPPSPDPARSASPPLLTPSRASLHRRQPSARKERTAAAAMDEGGAHSAATTTPSHASPSAYRTLPHISRTPLLLSSQSSSSFSNLPLYASPLVTARTAQPSSFPAFEQREEMKEEGERGRPPAADSSAEFDSALCSSSSGSLALQSALGLTAADGDPSFHAFVSSTAYAAYESEVVNNVDLLRRSNALNEDTADYALILQPDIVALTRAHTHSRTLLSTGALGWDSMLIVPLLPLSPVDVLIY